MRDGLDQDRAKSHLICLCSKYRAQLADLGGTKGGVENATLGTVLRACQGFKSPVGAHVVMRGSTVEIGVLDIRRRRK